MTKEQILNEISFEHGYEYNSKKGTLTMYMIRYKNQIIYNGEFLGALKEATVKNKIIELFDKEDPIAKEICLKACDVEYPLLRKKRTFDEFLVDEGLDEQEKAKMKGEDNDDK